jgi:hypothetical protein
VDDPTQPGLTRDALIVAALSAVFRMLRDVRPTARTRALLAQARSFDQAVKHWTTVPPSAPQLEAMFDLVTDLHAEAVVSLSRPPPRRRSSAGP